MQDTLVNSSAAIFGTLIPIAAIVMWGIWMTARSIGKTKVEVAQASSVGADAIAEQTKAIADLSAKIDALQTELAAISKTLNDIPN